MSALRYALHGQACAHFSISLTDSFQPTERQLSTRFGGGVPRRWRRLDSSSEELLGAAGCCEVNAFVGAVAERFRVGLAAAAERDRVVYLEPVAFGVEESDVALNEVGAVVGRCDCDVVHCSSCLWCAPARRMRAGALDGGRLSGREVAREGRG